MLIIPEEERVPDKINIRNLTHKLVMSWRATIRIVSSEMILEKISITSDVYSLFLIYLIPLSLIPLKLHLILLQFVS